MNRTKKGKIERRNFWDVQEYLNYCSEVQQDRPDSVATYYYELVHLLEWARPYPFPKCADLRPTFPAYLESLPHSRGFNRHVCVTSRNFFFWCRDNFHRYHAVRSDWIKSLRMRPGEDEVEECEAYTVDEVRKLIAVPADRLIERRDRAAAALLFLSGMRNGAFCTLPIHAIYLGHKGRPGMIKQWPKFGVRTKGGKAANTWLLNIPDLLDIVKEWDAFLRSNLSPTDLWYPNFNPQNDELDTVQQAGVHRDFNKRLKMLCEKAGVEYKSVHKLRHGHVVWAMDRAKNMADVKAISQNVMHSKIATTDKIYSRMRSDEVGERISSFM